MSFKRITFNKEPARLPQIKRYTFNQGAAGQPIYTFNKGVAGLPKFKIYTFNQGAAGQPKFKICTFNKGAAGLPTVYLEI